MRRILYCLVVIIAAQMNPGVGIASPSLHKKCPTVVVDCPAQFMGYDVPARFSVDVSGADPKVELTYRWTVSTGTIIGGQGTFAIIVDLTGTDGQTVTATVEVSGLDVGCPNIASCSTISCPAPLSRKWDEYGNITVKDEKKLLHNFAVILEREPSSQGYIIAYDKRDGEARARADRARIYLVSTYGIDSERIVTVDGGSHASPEVELWIAPVGANPPTPTPTVQPDKVKTNKDAVRRN